MLRNKPSGTSGVLQTHCRKGHEFTPENTITRKNGQRLCRVCRNANGKMWALRCLDKSHEASRRRWLRREYGMTPEEYDRLLALQGGVCAICGECPDRHLHVDHDHKTGRVRGLLCQFCNKGLGHFRDNPAILLNGIQYLTTAPR